MPFERVEAGAYVVELHGQRRPRTLLWLIAGEQAVQLEAFVMHVIAVPDPGPLHRHLLRRNLGLRTVHYATDDVGDLFLVGSLPHDALSEGGLDVVLGEVLSLLEQTARSCRRSPTATGSTPTRRWPRRSGPTAPAAAPPGRRPGRPTATSAGSGGSHATGTLSGAGPA